MSVKIAMEYLRACREAAGLTQEDVADIAGVRGKTVHLWEAGKNEPPSAKLALYIQAVSASPEKVVELIISPGQAEIAARVQALLATPAGKKKLKGAATRLLNGTPRKKTK